MSNYNRVTLIGNITRDPELKQMPSGSALVSFGMAINRNWKGKDGEKREETCFVDITMFGKRAEVIDEYFSKGSSIFIDGRLQYQQWDAKDGSKRSALKVIAEDFQFMGSRQEKKADEEDIPF
ncbi:MAG: single-stranded DNA-binding protein [Planctomycetes bacterium]|nr:single-stranded DNA-binding protein [Planctomycetota bacterium]